MKDTIRWQVPIPRALYLKLKMTSIEEGKTVCALTKSEIDSFINALVLKVTNTEEIRRQQEQNSELKEHSPQESQIEVPV